MKVQYNWTILFHISFVVVFMITSTEVTKSVFWRAYLCNICFECFLRIDETIKI